MFTEEEIELIKKIISDNKDFTRGKIAVRVCELLNWRQENSRFKIVACREALFRMDKKGIIKLPPPRMSWSSRRKNTSYWQRHNFSVADNPIDANVSDFEQISLHLVNLTETEKFWNYLIDRYHYLGYRICVGHNLKYLIYLDDNLAGCTGFADGVLKLNLRDKWIGWSIEERERNLKFVINNNRFLILPWVKVKNLASKVLSIACKQVQEDWERIYNYRPVLIETFVDISKFRGTCYKAANYTFLGRTEGKGRRGMKYFIHNNPKDVYVYPLCKDYLNWLKCY